ncbi:MAG TPA: hypothetical protein VGO93_13995 [Candidatus Xenobia bacterium]|jgi:hypothetical protein
MFGPLGILGFLLTVLMMIDCALNRRDLYWFVILVLLGPFGGLVYLIYHYRSVTFPVNFARLIDGLGQGRALKRCSRCFRSVDRLEPYEDGRSTIYICNMCKSEMEILRSDRLKLE